MSLSSIYNLALSILAWISSAVTSLIILAGEPRTRELSGIIVFLVTKAFYIAKTAKDSTGSIIASGIAGIFLFHMAENIGMVMGLLPITGVPLLFVSYGGSSLITSYILVGILLNISSKRQKTIFVK